MKALENIMKNGEGGNKMVTWDLNTPLNSNEKYEGKSYIKLIRMEDLQLFIGNTRLMDLKLYKTNFTWINRQDGEELIMCKLDIILIPQGWINGFLDYQLWALPRIRSKNNALLLKTKYMVVKNHPFCFENMWMSHPELEKRVKKW